MKELKTVLDDDASADRTEVLGAIQELGSATISVEGRSALLKEDIVPSILRVMLKHSSDPSICEAGCFALEGLLIDRKQHVLPLLAVVMACAYVGYC